MRAKNFLFETISTGLGGGSAGKSGGSMVGGPTTYEQEYNKFKKKGAMQITAMTSEGVKSNLDDEVMNLIRKIGFDPKKRDPRYVVYSERLGVEDTTDSILIAIALAQKIAKKNLDSAVVVYDRATKFPVVAYRGSEDLWYKTNSLSPQLNEKWSKKYKKSINCNNPKGFSQKAHCAGRKARQAGKHTKSKSTN